MKKYLLSLLIIAGLLIVTCGNEPQDEFYEGTPEDSTAIIQILTTTPILKDSVDLFTGIYNASVIPRVRFPAADSYFKADSVLIKQHVDSCALTFSALNRYCDLWFTRDTTCTVYFWDTFTVISEMHFDTIYQGFYYYPPGDTTTVLDTVMKSDSTGYFTKSITGEGLRHVFFEPVREAAVEDGETTWVITEPREWVLKRVSYGTYYYPDRGVEYPIISTITLTPRSGADPDTIFSTPPDTFPHHAMDRFRSVDSLITYTVGDTVNVTVTVVGIATDSVTFFASCGGAGRVRLAGGSGSIPISGSEIVNLYFEVVKNLAYEYQVPDKGYEATVWLIPVRVE